MPISELPWLPGGPNHVSHPSLGSENGAQFGVWAAEWPPGKSDTPQAG